MYDPEEMKNRIKALKKEKHLSTEDLARTSGVSKGTLAKILGTETKDPQISNIIKIAHALGTSADYIIFGKEVQPIISDYLSDFNSLNPIGQRKVLEYMKDLIQSGNYSKEK